MLLYTIKILFIITQNIDNSAHLQWHYAGESLQELSAISAQNLNTSALVHIGSFALFNTKIYTVTRTFII